MSRNSSSLGPLLEDPSTAPRAHNVPALVFGVALIVTITGGNVLVCVSVYLEKALKTSTNYFIVSLAGADLLLALLVLPLFVYAEFQGGIWTLNLVLCDFLMSMDVMLCTASIFNLCAISVDRFIAVSVPLNYSRRQVDQRQLVLLCAPWLLALAVASPVMFGVNDVVERDPSECRLEDDNYVVYSSVCSFFVPCPLMLLLYWGVVRGLRRWEHDRKHRLKVSIQACRELQHHNHETQDISNHTTQSNHARRTPKNHTHMTYHTHTTNLNHRNPKNHSHTTPDNHGHTNPENHCHTNPENHSHTNPENHGHTNPENHGHTTPENHGHTNPENHGHTNPENHGHTTPENHGHTTPENHGHTNPENHGHTTPENHAHLTNHVHATNENHFQMTYHAHTPPGSNSNATPGNPALMSPENHAHKTGGNNHMTHHVLTTQGNHTHTTFATDTPLPVPSPGPSPLPLPWIVERDLAQCRMDVSGDYTQTELPYPRRYREKSVPTVEYSPKKSAKINHRERKAMRVLPVVVGCFLFCWTPFFVVHTTRALCVSCHVPVELISTTTWLGYVNSALNPIIYTVFNQEFKKFFSKCLQGALQRLTSLCQNRTSGN